MKKTKNKKGSAALGGLMGIGVIALVAIAALVAYAIFGSGGGLFSVSGTSPGQTAEGCNTDPSLTVACQNKYTASPLTNQLLYKVYPNGDMSKGGAVQEGTCGTAITTGLQAGATVEYIANGSSTIYGDYGKIENIKCGSNVADVMKLAPKATTIDLKVFNQDDGLLNVAGASEALPANSQDIQSVTLSVGHQVEVKGAQFFVDYVKTNVDDITSSLGSAQDEPDFLQHNSTGMTLGTSFKVFEVGDVVSNQVKSFTFTPDIGGSTYGLDNMTIGVVDKDWYVTTSGQFAFGVEEPVNNVDVGATDNFAELFFTAAT